MPVPPLVLASASPRRRELLERVGLRPEVVPSTAAEPPHAGGSALDYCLDNARAKAEEVARLRPDAFVLGADTEVIHDGRALGKPGDLAEGRRMLTRLAGRDHVVVTAFVLIAPGGRRIERRVETTVVFKALTPREIDAYLATGEPFDKAGGYGIQGIGAFLVARIEGSYTNVVGLPLAEVLAALGELGGPEVFPEEAS